MNTSVEAETKRKCGVQVASADKKPRLACLGYVEKVGEAKESEKGYTVIPVDLKGKNGSRGIKDRLTFLPQFFAPGFTIDNLVRDVDEATERSLRYVHQKMMGTSGRLSKINGLAGDWDSYCDIIDAIQSLEDITGDAIRDILNEYLTQTTGGHDVGFKLKQRSDKTDEIDENGRPIRLLSDYMEVDEYFYPTEKKINDLVEYSKRNPNSLVIGFEVN